MTDGSTDLHVVGKEAAYSHIDRRKAYVKEVLGVVLLSGPRVVECQDSEAVLAEGKLYHCRDIDPSQLGMALVFSRLSSCVIDSPRFTLLYRVHEVVIQCGGSQAYHSVLDGHKAISPNCIRASS